jgi:hypothetical protein
VSVLKGTFGAWPASGAVRRGGRRRDSVGVGGMTRPAAFIAA